MTEERDRINYSENDIRKARKRAIESYKALTRESIRAHLYGLSYGKFQAEKITKLSDAQMKERHKAWKESQGLN